MTSNNLYYSLSLLDILYGINISEDDFEEIALLAWNQIGNKRTRLYKVKLEVDCKTHTAQLPCNVTSIEAVTADFEDFQYTSNIGNHEQPGSAITEHYIEGRKLFKSDLYLSGRFIDFDYFGGTTLYIKQNIPYVNVLYHGVLLDDNGLPEINDKEAMAIADYCAYAIKFKEGIANNNQASLQLAEMFKQKWLISCDRARVPEDISQNEMDQILDAKSNWNRKIFNKSYKALK